MGFEKVPPAKPPISPGPAKHVCPNPPQELPDGRVVPKGTVWRCDECGRREVAEIWATWYGLLIINVNLIFWLPLKFIWFLIGGGAVAWTPVRYFFRFWGGLYGFVIAIQFLG